MVKLRVGAVLKVKGTAFWGGPFKDITSGLTISTCYHAGLGRSTICIRGQYIKGLLRKWSESVEPLLIRAGILQGNGLTDRIFGQRAQPGRVCSKPTSEPALITIADAFPVRSIRDATDLFDSGEFNYLADTSGKVCDAMLDLISRIRIDDVSGRAAEYSLFHETRVVPGTLFYFEAILKPLRNHEIRDAARLLTTSITQLSISSAGRTGTTIRVEEVMIEPTDLLSDNIISLIRGWIK